MWEIWTNYLLPKALKSGPKSNKSPNLLTLDVNLIVREPELLQGLCGRLNALQAFDLVSSERENLRNFGFSDLWIRCLEILTS